MSHLMRAKRAVLFLFALVTLPSAVLSAPGPLAETCNQGQDDAHLELFERPAKLKPGVPARVIVRAKNTSQFGRTWLGEENENPEKQTFAYRLAAWNKVGRVNKVVWSNWACDGNIRNGDVGDQRAYLSSLDAVKFPGCQNITTPPDGTHDFAFDIMAPIGSTGTIDFAWSMVYDAGNVCQGFFGDSLFFPFDIDNGPTCSNTSLPVNNSQWLLQVWNNETQTEPTVEQRYVAPVGNGGFDLNLSNGASSCAGTEHYSTRLTRQVFLQAGDYTFQVHADDGVRLRVGGVTLIDKFIAPQVADFTATGKAGVDGTYTIEVDHFQQTGGAALTLSWFRQNTGGTPPAAPTGLTASAVGSGSIFLSWNAASGATSYNVKRTTDANPNAAYSQVATGVTQLTYTDPGLQSGTYYYVVTAVNSTGESGPSSRASATLGTTGPTCSALSLSEPDFAWLLEIFNNEQLANAPVETRYDATGDRGFNFSSGAMPPSQCVGQNNYSMRLTRKANFPEAGNYRFTYTVDDGIRIWLDGLNILDLWNDRKVLVDQSFVVSVAQGQHDLRVEYRQIDGGAQIKLDWARENGNPSTPLVAPVVTASAGNRQVTLNWTEVPNADIYHIKLQQGILGFFDIATRSDRTFTHTQLDNGTTYTYVVQAENFTTNPSMGPDSVPVSATPREPPQGNPTLNVGIYGPDSSTPIDPNSTLSLNGDGWPSPNPLQVRLFLSCPADRTSNCFGPVDILIDSADTRLRVNGASQDAECLAGQNPGSSFQRLHWICPGVIGNITLTPGQTRTIIVGVVVQPSELSTFNVSAAWGALRATESLNVPAAQIHPLIVIPGILGTMPPSPNGELDPQLGVYAPLMAQLSAIGYEEGATVFRFPYDWRNSNRVTAGLLRDRINQALAANRVGYLARDGKVDLLVHSMGGLITRVYVEGLAIDANGQPISYPATPDIRKIIFAASPHRGFPEDYKTYEGNNWDSFLADTPALNFGMDYILWPAFIKKHWSAAHPTEFAPSVCIDDPMQGSICTWDFYAMTHDAVGGIDSLREMLPTDVSDNLVPPFFGPYLCNSYPPCVGPYPFGTPARPVNPLLPGLNAAIGALETRIGSANLYVIYGTDPSPPNSSVNDTDIVFDVKPGQRTTLSGWANGEPERRFTSRGGDDLIPDFSTNLKLLLPSIPDTNVAGFRIVNGQAQYGLPGPNFRHKEIMWSQELQTVYAPKWLAGLGRVPFSQQYVQPDVAAALARGTGWILSGQCPVNLLLTDPQGRRLGFDPATGINYKEIPTSLYAAPNSENQFIYFADPPAGIYHLKVSAFGAGKFSLGLHQFSNANTPRRWMAEGAVNTGDVLEYDIVLDPTLPVSQHPPIADAGPDQTVEAAPPACMANVQLDGSRSSDPDGEALTFDWTGPFGFVTGARPLVALPIGSHDITLLVQDGQRQGRKAHTHVNVVGPALKIELGAQPPLLQPADGSMRSVSVTVNVTSACGGKATCRIVDVDSNEGDSHDWQITGALTVKLRAERADDGDGRKYKLRIECKVPGAETVHRTVNVKVPPPGRIRGKGDVTDDGYLYKFDFDVWESRVGKDNGKVNLDITKAISTKDSKSQSTDKFRSTRVDSVIFSNDDDFEPGSNLKVDTVKAYGVGTWNGKSGYTFEMKATDSGEPGVNRDYLKLEIRDPQGKRLVSIDEKIDGGNNQSVKPPK